MDLNTIDHIMSAVNGINNDNEDLGHLMRSLPHRTPASSALNSRNEINKTPHVNRPTDPVQSISSAENLSTESPHAEKQLTSHINVRPPNRELINQQKNTQKNNHVNTNTNTNVTSDLSDDIVPNNTNNTSHLTNIMGYNIPTTTIYFIAILVIIAVALYFLTAEKKKPIIPESEKGKRKEENE
jgi:uncharacterized membrane protein